MLERSSTVKLFLLTEVWRVLDSAHMKAKGMLVRWLSRPSEEEEDRADAEYLQKAREEAKNDTFYPLHDILAELESKGRVVELRRSAKQTSC
jgi:hypothetical protein